MKEVKGKDKLHKEMEFHLNKILMNNHKDSILDKELKYYRSNISKYIFIHLIIDILLIKRISLNQSMWIQQDQPIKWGLNKSQ